jgi:pimeloyl-ACP methyl ester carboxylesterase
MRYLWLHGFASGPTSSKGRFTRDRLRERGIELEIPDLNEPSFFDLTVSRMLSRIDAIAGSDEMVLFGSSLGGFTAAVWAATRAERTRALVLLAPAFDLARRWQARMDPKDLAQWRRSGRYAFDHYARGQKEDLSWSFLEDAARHPAFPLPRCPTLVVQGTKDEVVDPGLAKEFVHRMERRASLVELDEGHELTADLPGLWKRMAAFLAAQELLPTP